jgi:hypothetical protein
MNRTLLTLALLAACAATLAAPLHAAAQEDGEQDEITIPLERNTRFYIRPTLLGLVPPGDPTGYGGVFARITAVGDDALSLHYEIKEAVPEDNDEQTRIRRGEIEVTGLIGGDAFIPPLFWPDGDWQTDTGLLWLPRGAFSALTDDGSCPWQFSFDDLPTTPAIKEVQARLQQLGAEDGALTLVAKGEGAAYPCRVNGERASLPAVRAEDSRGLMECWILDDPGNPLVLKLSFLPPDGDELPPTTTVGEPLGVIAAGSGYAVVDIDF